MKQVVRALTVVIAAVGISAAIAAVMLDGPVRTALGATAVVLLFTLIHCAISDWLERPRDQLIDIDAPPPETPLPESPVTQVYDPPSSRDASPGRMDEGSRRA